MRDSAEEIIQVVEDLTLREMKNMYESQLIEKDAEVRHLKSVINQITSILGTMERAGITDTQVKVVSNGAVEMWKSKLGNTLAARILSFFAENPTREFNREQVALALGVPVKAGHTSNEWGRLMRTSTVVKNGSMYRLNPNL